MIKKIVIYTFLIQCIDKTWILPIKTFDQWPFGLLKCNQFQRPVAYTGMWKGGVGCESNRCLVGEGQVKLKSDL